MIVGGLNLDDLDDMPEQFAKALPGRVLILDGDGPAYVAAATVKTVATAVRRFQKAVLERMFVAQAESALVHLTDECSLKSGRFKIIGVKPYQGQRSSGGKPPLLTAVRDAASQPMNWLNEYDVTMHYKLEADDGMMYDSYRLKDHGIISSEDKDLRMTPYWYYDHTTGIIYQPDPVGQLWLAYTPSGSVKLLGHSLKFFWAQMMMGDSADNVKGLIKYDGRDCGPRGTFDALNGLHTIDDCANLVLDAYRAINQNPLPEGWFLWMLRWPGDSFWNYLNELAISPTNRDYLNECVKRDWFIKE